MPSIQNKGTKGNLKSVSNSKLNDHSRSVSKESSKSKQTFSGSKGSQSNSGVHKSASKESIKTKHSRDGSTLKKFTLKTFELAAKSKQTSKSSQNNSKSQASESGQSFVSNGFSNSKSSKDNSNESSN